MRALQQCTHITGHMTIAGARHGSALTCAVAPPGVVLRAVAPPRVLRRRRLLHDEHTVAVRAGEPARPRRQAHAQLRWRERAQQRDAAGPPAPRWCASRLQGPPCKEVHFHRLIMKFQTLQVQSTGGQACLGHAPTSRLAKVRCTPAVAAAGCGDASHIDAAGQGRASLAGSQPTAAALLGCSADEDAGVGA